MIALMSPSLAGYKDAPRKRMRDFIVDNAATCCHVKTQSQHFKKLKETDPQDHQNIGGIAPKDRVGLHGHGDVELILSSGRVLNLRNVAYVSNALANIFPVRGVLK